MARSSSRKRPSRLLNLNKASTANKRISAKNARNSPLLSLPPEIRSRIWGWVFYVGNIHIIGSSQFRRNPYYLAVCQCADHHEATALRIVSEQSSPNKNLSNDWWVADHQKCFPTNGTSISLQRVLSLDALRTCRLVYHEAVLRPFSSNTFQCSSQSGNIGALQTVFNALVPTQARAISRIQLNSIDAHYMVLLEVEKFKGLQHLDVQIALSRYNDLDLYNFSTIGVRVLRWLGLKSLRISTELRSSSADLTESNIAALKTWVRELQDSISDLNHGA